MAQVVALNPRNRSSKKGLKPMADDLVQDVVRTECEKAADWIESNIAPVRQLAESYFKGKTRLKYSQGRSGVIVSVVRDTIKSVLTSVGRVFTQTDTVGEFSSDDREDEEICKQMTLFVNGVFNKHGGYKVLVEASTDALHQRVGLARVTLQRTEIPNQETVRVGPGQYEDLQAEVQAGEVMITEATPPAPDPETGEMASQVTLTRTSFRNKWILECVAPESIIVDARATDVEDARLIGVREEIPIREAMEMGLSFADLEDKSTGGGTSMDAERINRKGFDQVGYDDWLDPSSRPVLITEVWMRMDKDGDGMAELRHFVCAGINYDILVDEPATCIPLALFKADLEPHVFFPIALAEDMIQDQDAQTAVMRSILDNVGLVNNPRTIFNPKLVNVEDLKNNELGAMIRADDPSAVNELATPFVAGETLQVLDYLRQVAESRSGVTRLSQGIDANALQSTSRIAANAAVQGSDARIEMMVRNLAETGVTSLFQAILRVAMYELKGEQQVKTPSGYKTIMPSLWHDQVNININVGMGNGRIEEKQAILTEVATAQQAMIQQLGPASPFMGFENARNTYAAKLRLSGIKTVGDYFPYTTPEQAQAFQQQQEQKAKEAAEAAKQAPQNPDLVGAAKVKAEADVNVNQAKIQAQQQADMAKISAEQQRTIAETQSAAQLELVRLQADLASKERIAALQADQRRDAENQKYAVQAFSAGLDAQTQATVARENAMNNQPAQPKPQGGPGGR